MNENDQHESSIEGDAVSKTFGTAESPSDEMPNDGDSPAASDISSAIDSPSEQVTTIPDNQPERQRKKKRVPNKDAAERRFLGRQALCKRIEDIAPHMLKTVKLRILGRFLDSTKGLDDLELANRIKKDARKLSNKKRLVEIINTIDPDVNRRNLKEIIVHAILLQEEAYRLVDRRLEEKVIEFEKSIVNRAKKLDFFDSKKHDPIRWHHYDTYRIVLEAAWRNEDDISFDEATLLRVLREHLNISREEHWLIGAFIKRFPKKKCAIHTADEIHEARKQLQKESVLWSYRDQNNRNIDVLPAEVVSVIRQEIANLELQRTNYRRMLQHDCIRVADLRAILKSREMDHNGNRPDLVERIINGDLAPSVVLDELDKTRVSTMCSHVGLKSSGNKSDLVERLITFYDDLTFEERETKDSRETSYNNYELLASRAYSDLRAKKLIGKDLEIEHQFEKATNFLIEKMLKVKIDVSRRITKADGRIPLDANRVILWDCKSSEKPVDLKDYLDDQFDGYMRREAEKGTQPLAFIVIGPSFTAQSIKIAHRYKARTNWDIALVKADALKYLAEQWSEMEPKKSFPINLFNRTEVIDRERVEFLLSLA